MTRRHWLHTALVTVGGALLGAGRASAAPPVITVQKRVGCGCCEAWAIRLRRAGFTVEMREAANLDQIKTSLGIPGPLQSCHTGRIDGFLIEGHVPAADIQRLLAERPAVVGLAVPGMPIGSPGMEGGTPQRYDVLAFRRDGSAAVFASH